MVVLEMLITFAKETNLALTPGPNCLGICQCFAKVY